MNKFENFINKHFNVIVVSMLLILFLRSCGNDYSKLNKRIDKLTSKIDTLTEVSVTKVDLQVEGLKTEKRMIQSTDRKMLDVTRQSQIDKELESLKEN